MKSSSRINRALMLAAIWAVAGTAFSQGPGYWQGQGGGPGYGPGMGHGMMGGYGDGPGYGRGYGMGPRGYGGQGYGPGPGMGPEMRGQGMGPGMMGRQGPGRGPGMMQGIRGRLQALGLNEDQRIKIGGIMEETRRKNWDIIGQVQAERFKLRQMFRGDEVDPAAITEQKRKVDDLKRQVLRARLEARNQVFALLTPEQREKARAFGPPRWGRGQG